MKKGTKYVHRITQSIWNYEGRVRIQGKRAVKLFCLTGEKSGEVKLSLRSKKQPILPALKKALQGVEGYGGGHEFACGANIKKYDFDKFIAQIRKQL